MPGAIATIHRDTDYLAAGTQRGSTGTTVRDVGRDFLSCGVVAGLAVKNVTAVSVGTVVSCGGEDEFVATISFTTGDTYEIYKTGTYNSVIETHWEDRRAGHKVTHPSEVRDGILPEDVDLDKDDSHVWGPGQPER